MHPNGQLPAYEWAFDDVNPPVHAWAALRVYKIEAKRSGGVGDFALPRARVPEAAAQLHLVGQPQGPHRPQHLSGRLPGLGQHRRVRPQRRAADRRLPGAERRHVVDGRLRAQHVRHRDRAGQGRSALRGHRQQVLRALPLHRRRDELRSAPTSRACGTPATSSTTTSSSCPTASAFRSRSTAWSGILPIFAVETLSAGMLEHLPRLARRVEWFLANRPELAENVARIEIGGMRQRRLLAIVNPERLRRILRRVFDESEFLSPHGMRMLSRFHREHPYVLKVGGSEFQVDYEPAESTSGLFGGNSNWRGPVWFPLNYLLDRVAAEIPLLPGRRLQGRVPDRLGHDADAVGMLAGAGAPAGLAVPPRRARQAPVQRRGRAVPKRSRTGATRSCFTSTSTATPAKDWAPRTRPAGRRWSPN